MVAGDNQWFPRVHGERQLKFWDYPLSKMGITPQNVPQTSNSILSPTKWMVAGQPMVTKEGQTMMHVSSSEIIIHPKYI